MQEETFDERIRRYNLKELLEVKENINRSEFPDRYKSLIAEIDIRHLRNESIDRDELDQYRTFWRRFWSNIVDGLIFLPLSLLTMRFMNHHQEYQLSFLAFWYFFTYVLHYVYNIYFLGKFGQTIGKRLLKIKVLDISEKRHITYGQALKRDSIPIALSIFPLFVQLNQIMGGSYYVFNPGEGPGAFDRISAGIGSVWLLTELITMFFNHKRRAVHDLFAGSVVVKQ